MRVALLSALALTLCLPVCAQDKKKTIESKTAETKTSEVKINWDGEWSLISDDSDNVEAKIDEHLKDLNFAMKAWWKRKLNAACKAHRTLDILVGESFSVTLGKEVPADTSTDGRASEWKRSDGTVFQVTMRKDGKTLAMQVTYAAPKLDNPFSYKLVFGRNE